MSDQEHLNPINRKPGFKALKYRLTEPKNLNSTQNNLTGSHHSLVNKCKKSISSHFLKGNHNQNFIPNSMPQQCVNKQSDDHCTQSQNSIPKYNHTPIAYQKDGDIINYIDVKCQNSSKQTCLDLCPCPQQVSLMIKPIQKDSESRINEQQRLSYEKRIEELNKELLTKSSLLSEQTAMITQMKQQLLKMDSQKLQCSQRLDTNARKIRMLQNSVSQLNLTNAVHLHNLEDCQDRLTKQNVRFSKLQSQKNQMQANILHKLDTFKLENPQGYQKQIIKMQIECEIKLSEAYNYANNYLSLCEDDFRQAKIRHAFIVRQMQNLDKQINSRIRQLYDAKSLLGKQVSELKQQNEKIRKQMLEKSREIISSLESEVIKLRSQNNLLRDGFEQKVIRTKLEREVEMLEKKNVVLATHNKEMLELIEKFERSREIECVRRDQQPQLYSHEGHVNIKFILEQYENRIRILNVRLAQKQDNQHKLKASITKLQTQVSEVKSQNNFITRKQKSSNLSSSNQIDALKLQLQVQSQSFKRKIKMLEQALQHKKKEIKQKDTFITSFMLKKFKNEHDVSIMMLMIRQYLNAPEI